MQTRLILARLAGLLNQPVAVFFNPNELEPKLKETAELFELWHKISDPAGRSRLVMHAREIVASCERRDL